MRPDELGILFLAVADVEQSLSCLEETVNFIKLIEASRHQFVGYGHFKLIFENVKYIIMRAGELFDMFCESYPQALTFMNSILDSHQVSANSPIGNAVKNILITIETFSISAFGPLINSYKEWIRKEEINPLPLLLSPDQLFSPINPKLILSPLPNYNVPPPTPSDIEEIPKSTHQSLLYHALLHAKERKTTLATEEMTRCCLKMTESNDSSCLSRSSIALAQIFDLLGMKEESILALNESVGRAKGLSDSSVISAAVALKAKIDASTSAWRYAAEMANPHPVAAIRVALENNDFPQALKIDSFLAANSYAENSYQVASVLPLNERLLPTLVLHSIQEGEWKEAAELIKQMNISLIEVRATALAFAVAYYDVHGLHNYAEIYRDDLNDVLEIELGHFTDLKPTIHKIANIYQINAESNNDLLPLDQPKLLRIKWMAKQNNSNETNLKLVKLCYECGDFNLYNQVKQKLLDQGIEVNGEAPRPVIETLDIEAFLNAL